MNLGEWKDIVLLAAGFVLSIGAGIIGAYIQRRLDRRAERRPPTNCSTSAPTVCCSSFPTATRHQKPFSPGRPLRTSWR